MKGSVDYDSKADILYVTFGTKEPSYCEEFDDILLLERGAETQKVTGYRIMGLKKHFGKFLNKEQT